MKTIISLAIMASLLCGCQSPNVDTSRKPDYAGLGTIAVLPFQGFRGEEFVTYIGKELSVRGAQVVELDPTLSDDPGQELSAMSLDPKIMKLIDGRSLEGIDHLVTGSLNSRKVFTNRGESRNLVLLAGLDIVSTKTGEVIARADYSRDTASSNDPQRIYSDSYTDTYFLPDMAKLLVVRIRTLDNPQ